MINSYYALIYFNRMLNASLTGFQFRAALTSRKNILEILFYKGNEELKLIVSVDSVDTALFFDDRIATKRSNVTHFFEELEDSFFTSAQLAENDRWLSLHFDNDMSLALKLFSGKPNVFLIQNGSILSSFKEPEKMAGQNLPRPQPANNKPISVTKGTLRKRITSAFPLLPRNFIADLIEQGALETRTDTEIDWYLTSVEDYLLNEPAFRRLSDGRFCMFPTSVVPDSEAEEFEDINTAVKVCFFQKSSAEKFQQLKNTILKRLNKESQRLKRLTDAAESANKCLDRAAKYEKFGNILLANAHINSINDDSIELPDLYENNTLISIPVKSEWSVAENAGFYFEKKKKSERSFEALLTQGEQAEKELREVSDLLDKISSQKTYHELKTVIQNDKRFAKYKNEASGSQQKVRPYLLTEIGPYEVWIGKNAKSNDALVRDAHKEDIWLHARGVSGSHVVIRMNKNEHIPDAVYLEKAAAAAAWKSKARGAEWVPVIWTKRKYVRKPKGAAPGAVVAEKEKVLIVQPSDL
jgi:predicted ribosome quality control (RQC) complex YloA/Tae2 family protein